MTGFGVGEAPLRAGKLTAEIRSTNQRFLDVRARLPREIGDLALFAEQIVRERVKRGRVEIVVHGEGALLAPRSLDKDRARAAFRAFAELRDELAPGAEVPLSLLGSVPDLFATPEPTELDDLRASVKLSVERALAAMEAMCLTEGRALARDLASRAERLGVALHGLDDFVGEAREAALGRARERVERLVASLPVEIDKARVEAEVALLAERADVTEELTRLASHLAQLRAILEPDTAAPVGRQLDFLLQEMLREANTLGAKAQDAGLGQRVIGVKVELERLREQVQNVE